MRSRCRFQDRDVRVRIDADLGGDRESPLNYLPWREVGILEKCACGSKSVRSARSNRENSVVWLDDVARAGYHKSSLGIHNDEQSLESSKRPVAPPILSQLYSGFRKVSWVPLQLFFKLFKKCKRIGGCARKSGQQFAICKRTNLLRIRLHDGFADGDLAIAPEGDFAAAADAKDRGGADAGK